MTPTSALERADRLPATNAHNPTTGREARSPVVPLIAVAAAAPTSAFAAVVARSVTTGALIALLMFAAVILAARMI
ncbi:hypothetical protein HYG77_33295 (plasmid) [Rhodococcus sp. ZPP]|uniref:hypothetical protein n=1 Tax=Rhodococcus sp. ZPP TaxID=2749906 RepID=UPI001AD8698A|nr:hypothetical protein [Rhodococcus sp. ZPP]QTJ70417.1 hypothetical protein HYG77_33295 [Rhodococcus sp. ZPP]